MSNTVNAYDSNNSTPRISMSNTNNNENSNAEYAGSITEEQLEELRLGTGYIPADEPSGDPSFGSNISSIDSGVYDNHRGNLTINQLNAMLEEHHQGQHPRPLTLVNVNEIIGNNFGQETIQPNIVNPHAAMNNEQDNIEPNVLPEGLAFEIHHDFSSLNMNSYIALMRGLINNNIHDYATVIQLPIIDTISENQAIKTLIASYFDVFYDEIIFIFRF